MKKNLIIPYILAIGVFNFIFTAIVLTILCAIFSNTLTLRMFIEHYIVGYIILFILNLKVIKEK
jgi:uncharacterized membrane protein YvlD (DUF360 family)